MAARENYDNSGMSTGLAVADVIADFETQIIANRKSVFESAINSFDFRTTVFANLRAFNEANSLAAQSALAESMRLAEDELERSYNAGLNSIEGNIKQYKKQGYKAEKVRETDNTSLLTGLSIVAVTLTGIISTALSSAQNQTVQITQIANTNAPDLRSELDNVQTLYLRKGVSGSTNINGIEQEAVSAAELTVRNESQKTLLRGEGDRASEYGISLVQISAHPSSCPLCLPWQSRVLVNDVFANGVPDGKHELLSTAINAGLFHYNCRHEYVAYIPDYSRENIFDYDKLSKEETSLRYAFEQEQRHNERMIRQWKREAEGSLTTQRQDTARMKVAEWQARQRALRDLAEERSIPFYRQYEREQIGGETTPTIKPEVLNYKTENNITVPVAPESDIIRDDIRSINSYQKAVSEFDIAKKITFEQWQKTERLLWENVEGIETSNGIQVHTSTHATVRALGNEKRKPVEIDEMVKVLQNPLDIIEQSGNRLKFRGENAYVVINNETGRIITAVPEKYRGKR